MAPEVEVRMISRKFVPTRKSAPILGARILQLDIDSDFQVAEHINQGLPPKTVKHLAEHLDFTVNALLTFTNIKSSTYHDRQRKKRPLSPEESSRIYRLAKVVEAAEAYFEGDKEAALRWLNQPKVALGGKVPLEFARTPEGSDYVIKLLGRMEHGVIS
jgi:putative toxin-antitoxin system antitoxin component (TIGR02293 family)